MRKSFVWKVREREIMLGEKTLVMGILNVTPDSFSDGGQHHLVEFALEQALKMQAQGAHVIDVGGESTRPGAPEVSLQQELSRVVPLIVALRAKSDILISVDTTKAEVAEQALAAGADIINDVSAFVREPQMLQVAKKWSAGVVLMHMRGTPSDMQQCTDYGNVTQEVMEELHQQIDRLLERGLDSGTICIDPGIGFSKTAEQSLQLMRELSSITIGEYPCLLGTSRKSFIGSVLNQPEAPQRLMGTAAAQSLAICRGAHIIRVHDVEQMAQVAAMTDAML